MVEMNLMTRNETKSFDHEEKSYNTNTLQPAPSPLTVTRRPATRSCPNLVSSTGWSIGVYVPATTFK